MRQIFKAKSVEKNRQRLKSLLALTLLFGLVFLVYFERLPGTEQKEEQTQEILGSGAFVEYQPPPDAPPPITMINIQTRERQSGSLVSYEWMLDGKRITRLGEPPSVSWPNASSVAYLDEIEWDLGTSVTPILIELLIISKDSFKTHASVEAWKHLASCQINSGSFSKLPRCFSARRVNGNWILTTPINYKPSEPLYVILTGWWQYIAEETNESDMFWGTWIFSLDEPTLRKG